MNVHYKDADMISIFFSSLVINVSSLNSKNYKIKEFVDLHNLECNTNGKLIVMHEMNTSHFALTEFVNSQLIPLGLMYKKDFVFIQEQISEGVEGRESFSYLGMQLPETVPITWLKSIMTKEGCFVWTTTS